MTGFARVRKTVAGGEIVLSLKSVNHRALDLHFHMPAELDGLEADLRGIIKNGMARGHVQIHAALTRTVAPEKAPVNWALLDTYMRAFAQASEKYQLESLPDLNAALRIPGMFGGAEDQEISEDLSRAVLDAAALAVVELNVVREREGQATAEEMRQRCGNISTLVVRMEEIREGAVPAFHRRLKEKLGDLLKGFAMDPQRLAQEAALLADRSDISEELVRLRTHATQLEAILQAEGEVGKRLDFLLQEMNREANTVLSKTGGLGEIGLTITELALAAKSEIDKIREQSLNLE
ncbi:MAG TPA: YicC/YloC family endoribonuclease [Candidatus Sulfopaludibacter sp.]|jgi:uncharacterized protein (TIGR00255 family)|nr:YicC/YloC family endoribonuclease [Candidatus Sulfopaludibacter sp.]